MVRSAVAHAYDAHPERPAMDRASGMKGARPLSLRNPLRLYLSLMVSPYTMPFASIRGRVFHFPRVKSGKSIGMLRSATDASDSGTMTLHAAASYTSISSGVPCWRFLINRYMSR